MHHLPNRQDQDPLPAAACHPLPQIQFKFLSGIYFECPLCPLSLSCPGSVSLAFVSRSIGSDGWQRHQRRHQIRIQHRHVPPPFPGACCLQPLRFFGVFCVECCNFNPLMDLMKLVFFPVCICCKISAKSVPKAAARGVVRGWQRKGGWAEDTQRQTNSN